LGRGLTEELKDIFYLRFGEQKDNEQSSEEPEVSA
jgi:hypothetical protein